jgi:hypothetical protein
MRPLLLFMAFGQMLWSGNTLLLSYSEDEQTMPVSLIELQEAPQNKIRDRVLALVQ